MLPEPDNFATYFHLAYKVNEENLRKRIEWKKLKKKLDRTRYKHKKLELLYDNDTHSPADIQLPSNASSFAVFATIRLAVLDRWMRNSSQGYLENSYSASNSEHHYYFDSDCDDDSSSNYEPLRVSKIVELGLRSVFELIKESRSSYPELCAKALSALLDVLQGQTLESLKPEPSDVIDPLFDLLLDLATSHGPESSVANDGSHVTALACSCLLSLVVVRGDTGKCLSAIAALLMSPRALALQNIQMSSVLSAMQRSVHSVLLGKLLRPDWISHGVPSTSKTDSFHLKLPPDLNLAQATLKSLAFDGQFLYIFCSRGLLKVGSGYGGTVKGQTVLWNPAFCSDLHGTLVFCSGKLYLKLSGKRGANVFIVNTNNCSSIGSVPLHSRDADSPVVFSDGEHLGTISLAKDDGIVVRTLNQNTIPASLITELPLKLVRKCFDVIGQTPFEDEVGCYRVSIGNDEEIASICSGKEFILIRTLSGKVFYSGKPSALGIKQAGVRSNKWSELVLTKSPKVVRVATGHESLHAIIITEDGSVFFTGTARRGEDGDQSKVRRQPKPVKPKKMIKVEGHHVLLGACNNGTTALITKEGKLLMFGKDTAHADPSTGVVTGLKGEFVLNAVLGKAHAVVLTDKGQIYTFGINNKFQCGREFTKSNKEAFCTNVAVAMETCSAQDEHDAYDDPEENQKEHETSSLAAAPGCSEGNLGEPQNVCPQGMHQWHDNMCMVCTVCRECTGYSISCLSSMSSERNPGQECGCGEGDSGCSICGCCRICAREVVDNSELADLAGMMRLDLIFRDNKIVIPPRQRTKLQEQIQSRLEERKNKTKKSLAGSSKQLGKMKSTRSGITATPTHRSNNTTRHTNLCTVKEQTSSDVERESARIACLPPAPLPLPCDSPVVQIACGLHHSVLLLHNGDVLTFGSNLYGQLGCGDILAKNTVQKVNLPANADLVAAGSNHTVVMTVEGEVYTFGNPEKGQLGRPPPQDAPQSSQGSSSSTTSFNNPRTPWYSVPGVMPNVGPKFGRRAIWIGASGDQTFVKLDESLINSVSISKSTVTANKNSIVLLPSQETACRNFKCLVINKKDGNCNSFANCDQADFSNKLICMDPIYNVLWSYNPSSNKMTCYNIINTELQSADCAKITQMKNVKNVCTERKTTSSEKLKDLGIILSPELALPVSSNCHVTRFQAAINLLCCLDTLTAAQELHLSAIKEQIEEKQAAAAGKMHSKENYQFVNRFESHGGGWGYSGHSVEAVRFMADTDILLGGYGLFGGRGEYTAKIKLLELGPNGGELDQNGTPKADTYETPYECGPRQKYAMFFDAPIPLQAHHWYIAWCQISGPSSDCGSSGQAMVTTEDQVTFYFKSSKMSNNGTDVNAGQIPQLIYKIITPEIKIPTKQVDVTEPVHILSKEFSKTVSKECFQSLLSLLQWSWNTFKCGVTDGQSSKNTYTTMELERLVYISTASLRLIRIYINEIYPKYYNTEKELLETVQLAECIGDIRTLLKQILSDNVPLSVQNKKGTSENVVKKYASGKSSNTPNQKSHSVTLMKSILDQCHNTFVSCFHAFYPTTFLKWNCLCELLADSTNEEQNTSTNGQMLLSAVLCALCDPNLKLRETFPLLGNNANTDNSLDKSDNSGLPMLSMTGSYHHPILVEQMSYRSQIESIYTDLSWQWKDVLQRLIHLVSEPVLRALQENAETSFSELSKYCCHLLGRVLAELVLQCNSIEQDPQNTLGRTLHVTPSRFTRTNQSRTWNTGNGAPDAICFQVDRAGVSVQGVGVYGGVGHYEYELELLEDTSSCNGLQNHAAHRWSSLETIRGYISPEDYAPDIMDLKFDRLVPIKANVKYALRLRNHGGRTNNGDGGLSSVKGSDNTTFTFSTCSLSFNGTTVTRGQIPVIYYYSDPIEGTKGLSTRVEMKARQTALSMTSDIVQNACKLMILAREKADEMPSANVLSNSCLVKTLLPLVLAHVSPLASSDPKSAIHVSTLIQEILPHVAALNLSSLTSPASKSLINSQEMLENKVNTTSNHCTIVESDHPYKPTTVANYRVAFPESVKWMSLEFDPSCSTAQPEDSLQLYVPSFEQIDNKRGRTEEYDVPAMPYWPVLHKFSGSFQWPKNTVILPGNEVVFSLETASDYLKDDRASSYGFKCLVTGYEWPLESNPNPGLKHLEMELAFLGGMCASSLMKKDILLPPIGYDDVDMKAAELVTLQTFYQHGALLSKGLALSAPPSVNQALDGTLPFSAHSNERLFLRDFVMCVQGSSGGRLAQWLQPGSRVDPSKCQVMYSREDLRCGWPATITILTRDQYSDLVQVPNMKVDVRAIPIDKKELGNSDASRKMRRVSQAEPLTFGNLPAPPLQVSYEKTVRDKMCFHSITAMKPFQNYSFEELRYLSPPVRRSSENMLVRPNGDGSYSATWTPGTIGCYSLVVNLDGYEMEEAFKVEVKEPPQGVLPPNQNVSNKSSNQPSKVRKFVAKNSAGLRIRAHPSLQSEQIGVVHVNGIITFIDEIHNDDGVWLRLSQDTIKQYCNSHIIEAWCLQYNQHLGKTLLLPVEEQKSVLDQVISDTIMRKLPEIQDQSAKSSTVYRVIKCGASGHNIRSRPSLKAAPVGILVLGNRVGVSEFLVNSEGCWVLLDNNTTEQYCFDTGGEAWSLAIGTNNVLYLENVNETDDHPKLPSDITKMHKRGYNFSCSKPNNEFAFASNATPVIPKDHSSSTNPFVFGESDVQKVKREFLRDSKFKDLGGSNGNGITPPGTPKRPQSPRATGILSPKIASRSCSPMTIPSRATSSHDSSPSHIGGSSRSIGISPLASSTGSSQDSPPILRRDSSQSDTNLLEPEQSPKKLTQTGTQTSPENTNNVPVKGHFSIGATHKEERVSPKMLRKDRGLAKSRPKRAISPANMHNQIPTSSKMSFTGGEQAKTAVSPSVAESLRAVFAAFLWQEGIVHDAMACASFLKFHPTLPKQGALVVTRNQELPVDIRRKELTKEERARQRHSVEVSNAGNYLHIQPSTLESLTRSAANANANRNRPRKRTDGIIKEENDPKSGSDSSSYGYQTISVLPPALKSLVHLWEELTTNCLQVINEQAVGSPIKQCKRSDTIDGEKEEKDNKKGGNEKEGKKNKKKKILPRGYLDDIGFSSYAHTSCTETYCELCGEVFPHPVTYHMRGEHPGCGQHAGGQGYNSAGNYCLGWAGNCGDGGVHGSSWYLLCDGCREKYVKMYRGKATTPTLRAAGSKKKHSSYAFSPSEQEPHIIMKNNALFLLDMASSAESNITNQRRSSISIMPSVSENNSPPDCYGPFGPPPPFQCLQTLGANMGGEDAYFINDVLLKNNLLDGGFGVGSSNVSQRPLSDVSVSENETELGKGMRFHRSVSMGTNGIPWSKSGHDGRIIMMRKRNNSSSEIVNDGGSSLLCHPSTALQKLIPKSDLTAIVKNEDDSEDKSDLNLLQRPALKFIVQQHDLNSLKIVMKQAIRKAMCRVFALQAINWLLRSVTQPTCLHDLLWWFVSSLTPVEVEPVPEEDNKPPKRSEEQDLQMREHPLWDIAVAGDAVHPLPSTFHALLQTIANLMVLLPMGSPLQQIAVRCWGLRFASSDHSFLHRSQVFNNISKILSRSEELEDFTVSMHESHHSLYNQITWTVESLKDLTPSVEIKASSRQAMIGSLTDGSTETFWESGDEDRNKTKTITIICPPGNLPSLVSVHVDNSRDVGYKISTITFLSGPNTDALVKLRTTEVEVKILGGWVHCPITEATDSVIRLELRSTDNSVRLRQIKVLGTVEGESRKIGKQYSASTIQQRNCEAETLRVFRLITSQVFGKLIQGDKAQNAANNGENGAALSPNEGMEPLEESNELREHMVGILFSRSKLTHLQKQVIVHIVQAIRKETERVKDEWENTVCTTSTTSNQSGSDAAKNSDTYCFEMLSMVLALSGSSVGRSYLSHQGGLLGDLLTLLHTGSARVQRQVTSLLRRMLPEITPEFFAKVVGVTNLPPKDFDIVSVINKDSNAQKFDANRLGILDIFLAVIAKSLTVQIKTRGKTGTAGTSKEVSTVTLATSVLPRDYLRNRWWLRGTTNRKLAEVMVQLITDMSSGKMSDIWANTTKGAIAENILHLTYLNEEERNPDFCLKNPTLWIALASLCVLDKDHVDRLSSGQWSKTENQTVPPRPLCSNHDDGETTAVIQCNSCGNLCTDCDRFLHLNRKYRNHQRQVCKEEEEAIKVELHEGCGRTKLFWLLALADSRTLKALVEFREGGTKTKIAGITGMCRFCGTTGNSGLLAIGNVCVDADCQEYGKVACTKMLSCGHMCGGVLNEAKCLPCLHGCSNDVTLRQDSDDMCMICFTEALSCAPSIQLQCGHVFHLHCCKAVLMKRWAGPRITFSFSLCPICKIEMQHNTLEDLLKPVQELFKDVRRKALMRLEYEGLHKVEAVVTPGGRFYNDPTSYAMDRYAYYVCYKCNKAYYGGEARCDAEIGENYDPTELVCGACSDIARAQMCPKHGTDFLEYKCRYCCSVAVFFCFGTTHFCNPCHDDFQRVTNLLKNELPVCPAGARATQLEGDECPLHVKHPPTGEEFALGCGVCRNAHTF